MTDTEYAFVERILAQQISQKHLPWDKVPGDQFSLFSQSFSLHRL